MVLFSEMFLRNQVAGIYEKIDQCKLFRRLYFSNSSQRSIIFLNLSF